MTDCSVSNYNSYNIYISKYIDNIANYIHLSQNPKEYRKQILEKEAGIADMLADWVYNKALKVGI